ncbi:hypothetical protein MIMGU_mgv1a009266mg [Erythranthe guttata]|uniref:Srp40 C-terminal domain-containing protein n=1 Tax=Erythranthe guttata TaxID=4155 RepID=A0A022REU4_ERYGU|nr:PREDICTED: nucleolar and coiled-body phosphoprotein 1 [Erythranthe guttata]EYU38736.1 hypothetical protein MIMGU_mgv1a009266mg [Erythranthe guttata]|eukprot:XP_012836208.1 PREDICTED: nucleolar and coiled-body phosphoprotein 1 [Erythranthe guttata]
MRRGSDVSPSPSFLLAFKPRQVILLEKQQRNPNGPEIQTQMKPEDESILASSVALWLESKGFSKVLKRFLSAAQIQDDNWKSKALDLNEIFSKYQEISNEDLKLQKNQEEHVVATTETNGDSNLDIKSTKKKGDKKRKKSNASEATKSKDEVLSIKSSEETKLDKKSEEISVGAAENGVNESKKSSKKRKRIAADENENQSAPEVAVEESKAKKSKGLKEGKDAAPQTAVPEVNGHADKQNGNLVDNSTEQKSARKKHNNSAEPKAQIAFQRVKVEEVKFADERLQDNSYWAKDGADIGYGAKAQEVLGQVKGRDFRHEKTKKKRGSYRGGQIDLHSHSIKFNYSDEE